MYILACTCDGCNGLGPVIAIIRNIVTIIQWIVPVILILMGTIDLVKAVTQGKEDDIKKGQKTLITRAISAVIVFLIPIIVNVIINFIGRGSDNYATCWSSVGDCSIADVLDEKACSETKTDSKAEVK